MLCRAVVQPFSPTPKLTTLTSKQNPKLSGECRNLFKKPWSQSPPKNRIHRRSLVKAQGFIIINIICSNIIYSNTK